MTKVMIIHDIVVNDESLRQCMRQWRGVVTGGGWGGRDRGGGGRHGGGGCWGQQGGLGVAVAG